MDEIKVTWNLLLSACMFPLLIYLIQKLGKDAAERSKEMRTQIESLTKCMTTIKVEKLDREEHDDHCESKTKELWDRIYTHSHKGLKGDDGDVVVTAGGR